MTTDTGAPIPAPVYDVPTDEARARTAEFLELMGQRRSIRHFSEQPVDFELVRRAIATAATAPSGANSQPWRFIVVSSPETKRRLREAAEPNEDSFYHGRASTDWLDALRPIGTNWIKPFLEAAPYLIVVLEVLREPPRQRSFYAKESCGIAVGLLLASLRMAGLGTLTYTSSPFRWVNQVLGRPSNEHPFAIVAVGHPAEGALVPDLARKPLDEVLLVDPPRDDRS